MQIFEHNTIKIVCETWKNGQSWGHKATLFRNGNELHTSKVRYYNRTWERYTYQSVILNCIFDLIETRRSVLIATYKTENDVKRLTKKTKANIFKKDAYISELQEAYDYFNGAYNNEY